MSPTQVPVGVKIFTVAELTGEIKGVLDDGFANVWVTGEISGLKKHANGHLYFTLKDTGALLNAVVWQSSIRRLHCEPKDGLEVFAHGRVDVYPLHGKYQFVIDDLHIKGQGAQELALEKLRQKLFVQGYFDPKRKRALPRIPQRVCLVTSRTGAAVRDMLKTLKRRWPATEVWIHDVRVQGETAAGEIAAALALVNRVGGVNVIIVGRGGGSKEDLAAFNDERVADAIFASRIPVVSAVGHEIDETIADKVADVRASTPSVAAELVVPDGAEMFLQLRETERRMGQLLWRRLQLARKRLNDVNGRRCFLRPLERVQDLVQQLDDIEERLQRAIRQRLEKRQHQLQALAGQLESLSPLNVLGRGYSLTRRSSDQQVVRSTEQLRPGDVVLTVVQQGQFTSRVEETAVSRGN
jgi:exodeoxyribonuclease VII large subunit